MKTRKIVLPAIILLTLSTAPAFGSNCCPSNDKSKNGPGQETLIQPIRTMMPASVSSLSGPADVTVYAPDAGYAYLHPAEMLMGRVAGVWVSGGYNDYTIRIRGAMGPPLLVIDEMPFYNYGDKEINELLWSIPPTDIDRIEVLKNAATAGIYGGQAGNGVIRIVTKGGEIEEETGEY
ncbi:MAG: TonB-dependent receptor plug domain-containing protein [Phaeodactylibacter sp.]|nr:TonB-dependent receptor plug domain-containing protein [Phaeodactylibacter sp.]